MLKLGLLSCLLWVAPSPWRKWTEALATTDENVKTTEGFSLEHATEVGRTWQCMSEMSVSELKRGIDFSELESGCTDLSRATFEKHDKTTVENGWAHETDRRH